MQKNSACLENITRCLLYGAGSVGEETVFVLKRSGITPVAFLDTKKNGFVADIPVFPPDDVPVEFRKLPIIISIFSSPLSCSLASISKYLKELGYEKIISFETLYCMCHQYFEKKHYWLSEPDFFIGHFEDFMKVSEMLADDISKILLKKQLSFRLSGRLEDLPSPSPIQFQYFDPSVYSKSHFYEFWDLGAYIGDTLALAEQNGKRIEEVIAFEPDINNYIQCCHYLCEHRAYYKRAMALPLAIGDVVEKLNFDETAFANASVQEHGKSSVCSINLDAAFIDFKPDFIKMDIEGSELPALMGMIGTIKNNRPLLAISIYHRPGDIYEIPLFLMKALNDYKFHIRCYGEHLFDTVLYAVPKEIGK